MNTGSALDRFPTVYETNRQAATQLFDGGGQMGELMRSIDWSKTPVGPVESWPQSLKTALSVLLKQRTAVFIFWGPEHVQFYNDAYRPILGIKKHPAAMGQRGAECWPEIWDIILPLLETVHRGDSTGVEDGLLVIDRNGYLEEGYYTYTYSPIAEESGTVGGVFCIVYDTTARVIGERRLRTLRDLASRTTTKDPDQACRSAIATLADNPYDVPFAVLYLFSDDRKSARLVGATGTPVDAAASPRVITFEGTNLSVIAQAATLFQTVEIPDLAERIGPLPGGPWPVGAEGGIVLPLAIPGQTLPVGFMIAGINPRKRLDTGYRTFFELAAGQIATAIAEARAYEEERKRAEALAELDRAKTAFFSNVSHEFRTPLTLMLGPISDLLSKPDLSADQCKTELAVAHRNCLRLFKLVNTLLEFSRIEAGRIQAHYEPTDLATLTSDLASVFRSATERANLRLLVRCAPLPEPVFVDRDMWEKIVLNLLSNAFKFTLEGEIEVDLIQTGRFVELSVRDTGVGIPESEISKVFERFHRIEGTRGRSQEGSGIGLALVQELTRLHGGSVSVESTLGKGTTFRVRVPLGSRHLPQDKIGVSRARPSKSTGAQPFVEEALRWLPDADVPTRGFDLVPAHEQLGGESALATKDVPEDRRARILVADDNSDMRDYLGRLLGEHYRTVTVSDGAQALEMIRKDPPDLLLADVMMPVMNGFGLLQAIRTDPRLSTLPVILLSARAGEESRVEGLQAGADDYVVKPFSAHELMVRVSSRLEISRLRRDAAGAELHNLRNLIQHAPAAVALLHGPEHVFELVNAEYLRVTGRTENQMIGKPVREALPEITSQAFPELLDRVYKTSEPYVGSEVLARLDIRGNGRLEDRYFNFVYQPWKDIHGRTEGVFVHAVDISEQVLARQRLAQSEARFREVAEVGPQFIWVCGPNGEVEYVNSRWTEYSGIEFRAIADYDRIILAVHPDDRAQMASRWQHCVAEGLAFEAEARLRRKDGAFRWFVIRSVPVKDVDGRVVRWFGASTDIDEQKRIEAELRRVNQDLEQFAYSASHDLQEPLRSIKIYGELLTTRFGARLDGQASEFLEYLRSGASRMEMLVRDLLTYTQVGKLNAPAESVDTNIILHSTLSDLSQAIAESGATVTYGELPSLRVHSTHIHQLFQNLISNAIKYRRPGCPPVVDVGAQKQEGYWTFSVRDNGIGIEDEYKEHVFALFKRLHTNDEYSGTGIGLAVCQRIVERYQGRIWVESEPGRGSTFKFAIPA
jgi:PAS domain S-box-containing protein